MLLGSINKAAFVIAVTKKNKKKKMENKEKKGIENHFATYQLKIYFPFTL